MKTVTTAALAIICSLYGWPANNLPGRQFTVKDLIELSYFIETTEETNIVGRGAYPPGEPIISPDHKHFFLITQRGVLATNRLEGTLWVLDEQAVSDYVSKKSLSRPIPRQVAKLSAQSNTPVISSARWLKDSHRIAFLGKNDCACQQLFVADLSSNSVNTITDISSYVTAYDIRGETIAYTTVESSIFDPRDQLIDVTGSSLYALLFQKRADQPEEFDEGRLRTVPNVLHVERNGRELPLRFLLNSKPLRLFMPTLALSPDEGSLVTVAPISEIPPTWEAFQPASKAEFLYLKHDNRYAVLEENPFKASQYVIVNLHDGSTSPILDAPAGRGLGYYRAPTKGVWFNDNRRVILSNTFLPLNTAADDEEKTQRANTPSVAVFDSATHTVQPIVYIDQPSSGLRNIGELRDVSPNEQTQTVDFDYARQIRESYGLKAGVWIKMPQPNPHFAVPGVELTVKQSLNQPPVLVGELPGGTRNSIIWDPNPELAGIGFGETSVYHWKDQSGSEFAGVLALPPNFNPNVRYPLVIQTHNYNAAHFFADGAYTTGYGGRALVAKDIIVLQANQAGAHLGTPDEGPDQIDVFKSAINQLSASGLVDPHRVGIIGFSRTCFHVLYAMTHEPDLFAAASITDGLNFGYLQYILFTDYVSYQKLSEDINGGVPFGDGLKQWAVSAPGFNVNKINTPLLISALEKGELVWEWETYSGLRRLGKPVDMWWWQKENTPHILTQPAQRFASQQLAVDWFDFWLNGHEDPDPAKSEQYGRWRALRPPGKRRSKRNDTAEPEVESVSRASQR